METQSQLTPEQRRAIADALVEKGATLACPRCGTKQFSIADGFVFNSLQPGLQPTFTLGGPFVPSVLVLCEHCGYVVQHALGALGLLPLSEQSSEQSTSDGSSE